MSFGDILSGLFGGATPQETQDAKEESEFMSQMQQETGTIFNENQDAQNKLNSVWDPIVKGGPYQYGFSTSEDSLLQNQIRTEGATATANTLNAEELRQQQATGGASAGPSGGQAAIEAMASQEEAQATAGNIANERLAGYQQGSNLFSEATGVKENEEATDNAASYSNAATGAAGATNNANQVVSTANANSLTAKLIGGAAQVGLSAATGGISSALGAPPVTGAPSSVPGYASGIGNTFSSIAPPVMPVQVPQN